MRARAFIAAAVALAFVVLPIAVHAPPSLASPTPKWTAGLKAALPADAATNPDPNLTSVSCASAGSCAAVGSYTDASGHSQGLLLSESSNVWSAGMKAPLPADAGNDPSVSVTSVSCVSAGSCTAVGAYQDSSGHSQGLLLSKSSGAWTDIKAPLPADAGTDPGASIRSVSCTSAVSCTAVGSYKNSSGQQGLLLSESSGSWTAAKATPPGDAGTDPLVGLDSVRCPSPGNCVAIGGYRDSFTRNQALLLSESSGTWSSAAQPPLPADGGTEGGHGLRSVSCPSASNCAVTGYYYDSSNKTQGLLLNESSGTWTAIKASLPADASSTPAPGVDSVSCASAGRCAAVGYYHDASGHSQGLLLSESANVWSAGMKAPLPADAGTDPGALISSVSCVPAGNCRAVGSYKDSSGNEQGLLLRESLGIWSTGVKLALPSDAGTNPYAEFSSVSCASAGTCGAIGYYEDSSNHNQGFLVSTIPPAVISNMRVSPSKFSLAGRKVNGRCVKPTHKNNHNQHCRRGIKLSVSYSLNVSARVTFTIQRKAPGRKVSGRCVKPTAKNGKHARCIRLVNVRGRIIQNGKAGRNHFTFKGKIGGRSVGPGTYQLIATPAGGRPSDVTFKIVR